MDEVRLQLLGWLIQLCPKLSGPDSPGIHVLWSFPIGLLL